MKKTESKLQVPIERVFNGKKYRLAAGTQHGTTKDHALTTWEFNKKYGMKYYRIIKKGKDYFLYTAQ